MKLAEDERMTPDALAWRAAAKGREFERRKANLRIHWLRVQIYVLWIILAGHVAPLYLTHPKLGWLMTTLSLVAAIAAVVIGAWKAPAPPPQRGVS